MALETTSDLQEIMATFGTPAVVSGVSITAIFDVPYIEVLETDDLEPTLTCITSDVVDATNGTTVVVPEVAFSGYVVSNQPDGTGLSILVLGSST